MIEYQREKVFISCDHCEVTGNHFSESQIKNFIQAYRMHGDRVLIRCPECSEVGAWSVTGTDGGMLDRDTVEFEKNRLADLIMHMVRGFNRAFDVDIIDISIIIGPESKEVVDVEIATS